MITDTVKILIPAAIAFFAGLALTPLVTGYLYKHKMWKKKSVSKTLDGREATISNKLHADEEKKTPRMGGIIIWLSAFLTTVAIWLLAQILGTESALKLDFLSRDQTWLPLFALMFGAAVGLIDDLMSVRGATDHIAGGFSLKKRLILVTVIALFCALWFFFKLEVSSVGVPFYGYLDLGWLFVPFFVLVVLAIYSSGVIDGLDGLSGGIFATIFSAYTIIAFAQGQIDLAAFSAVLVGAILAFLWFNVPPARFYMSETGTMALTLVLALIAFMTDSLGGGFGVVPLILIGLPLLLTSLSVIIQMLSKKFRNGRKVFLVAPIHHHFQALGWPAAKVVMRFWILAIIFSFLGVTLALIG